ncbi:MAG: TonB-dependent receptor [Cyclobacteriaceae bacterium]|nr:TonB-dependent receptor [Cyclobacteriaceae bacterium]
MAKSLKAWITILLLVASGTLYAQQQVTGTISDENNDPIPFTNVLIKGTQQGTTSDVNGKYSILAEEEQVLVFSYIGYSTVEVPVGKQSIINVQLKAEIGSLQEVVVIGYGEVKKQDLTGSVAVLDTEELTRFPVANLGSAMQGRLSGVQVVNASEPGANPQILVRGFGTIFGDPNPLVVIDGLQTGVGALANIDPNSIESLQVLKDASAAAIYGSRAANGVIIITTKKGREDSFEVNYSSEIGVQMAANRFDLMNTEEYADYTSKLYVNSSTGLVQRRPPAWTQNPDVLAVSTDWQNEIFSPALMQNHNLNFSGGGKGSTYYMGFGYLNQQGVVPQTGFERYNFQINSQIKRNKFTAGQSLNLFYRDKPQSELTGNASRIYEVAPQIPVSDPDNLNGLGAPLPSRTGGNNMANPLAFQFRETETKTYGVLGNVYAEYEFVKGLSLRSDLNIDLSSVSFQRLRTPVDQSQAAITRNDTEILLRNFTNTQLNSETILRYNRMISDHSFNIMVGYTSIHTITKGVIASADNLEPGTRVPQTGLNQLGSAEYREERLLSQLARVNYNYQSRYLFTASIRRDGSSNFGKNHRWGIFPSFSAGWQLGDEAFMAPLDWLSTLKIRAGYGELGRTLGSFIATMNSDIRYPWPTGMFNGTAPLTVPNEDLRWETVKQYNLGIDMGFFDEKLRVNVDLYSRQSEDMIIRIPVPQYTGIIDQPWFNFGSMVNKGIEVELSYNHQASKNFNQQFKFNITLNRNELLELDNTQDTLVANGTLTTIGQPVAVHYGWLTNGINPQNGSMRFRDLDGDGLITGNDRVVLGSPHPDAFFGFTWSANIRNFDVSLFLQGVLGNQIMNESLQQLGSTHRDRNRLRSVLDNAWDRENNPEGTWPIISLRDENNNDRISERYIENGDYIRVRNAQVGYVLPDGLFKGAVKRVRLYASVINLLTITGYSGLDPDLNNNGDVFSLGRDTFRYPPMRSYNFGVQASF